MMSTRLAVVVATPALLLASCVSGGGGRQIDAIPEESDFSRLWPNADGNSWTYDYQRHIATESIIPQIDGLGGLDFDFETMDYRDLEPRLVGDLPESGEVEDIGILRLEFRGMIASLDGPKQNLDATFESSGAPATRDRARGAVSAAAAPFGASSALTEPADPAVSPIMARIYVARPDLRAAMIAKGYVPANAAKVLSPQSLPPFQFLDTKFEKKESWMGSYGDIRADSAYTYVQEPIAEGSFFRHQLVPDLASDIWEFGWVLGEREIATPAGDFTQTIAVAYVLDFGISRVIDEQGNEGAAFRSFTISLLYFAPNVGPVYQRTIDFLAPPIPELAIDIGTLFSEVSLREYHVD